MLLLLSSFSRYSFLSSSGADPGFFEVRGVNATDDNSDSARPEKPRGWGSWGGNYNPSPPASDGTISCISDLSDLTVLLNFIIKFLFSCFSMPGVRPNALMVDPPMPLIVARSKDTPHNLDWTSAQASINVFFTSAASI
jgi:hypothetical protein